MIKILTIGNPQWIDRISMNILNSLDFPISIERISDESTAKERLTHNSYDILLLQDEFIKNTIDLTKLAYAMTRPSIMICDSYLSILKYSFWRIFSRFARKHKISSRLIHFSMINDIDEISKLIPYLAYNHLQYFKAVNSEFSLLKNV